MLVRWMEKRLVQPGRQLQGGAVGIVDTENISCEGITWGRLVLVGKRKKREEMSVEIMAGSIAFPGAVAVAKPPHELKVAL